MARATSESAGPDHPYKPSWVDRVNAWVAALPVGAATCYAAFGGLLILVQLLILWLEVGLQATSILPVIVYNGLAVPYLLALIHFVDDQAVAALGAASEVFSSSDAAFEDYRYRIATMPFPASLISGTIMTVLTMLTERVSVVPASYAVLERLPAFAVIFQIVDKSSAFLVGALIYHTVRQLRLLNAVNAKHLRVSLFRRRPLQAFSVVTGTTAVGFVGFVYAWILINPEISRDPVIVGYAVAFTLLALLVFVWPLYGVHRRLAAEKDRELREIDRQLETAFSLYRTCFDEDDRPELERLNGVLASLETQRSTIEAIPTWPWRPETGQLVLTALALPLVLMVLQYFVEQALD